MKNIVSDCRLAAIRTGECAEALLTILACVLAMSPSVTRSPAAIRKIVDEIGKRLRGKVAAAETNEVLRELFRHSFRGNDVGGNA